MGVYDEIYKRLNALSIDLNDYIYINPRNNKTTLQIEKTTLDGISFVAGLNRGHNPAILGDDALSDALVQAKTGNGQRAFAGQISKNDKNNLQLQLSFLATKGQGFREIFYLPDEIIPARDFQHRVLLNQDNRLFDLRFGKMMDAPEVTSIHVDMQSRNLTSIHLDKQGFVFADRDGKIYLASNVAQHIFDELMLKDKFFGLFGDGAIPTYLKKNITLFSHLDKNSLSDPTLGSDALQNNLFLHNSRVRAILGVEASYNINRLQLFGRASAGFDISNDKFLDVSNTGVSGIGGLRGRF